MTDKEAMKLALDALELVKWTNNLQVDEAIAALKERLAQPEQEPMAHDPLPRACNLAGLDYQIYLKIKAYMPVHATTPPQRTWVGLTQKEVQEIHDTFHKRMGPQEFASMIDAKLKEKNT